MALRLTDTKKWDSLWFRQLSPSHKTTWTFLYDHCGSGGVWDRDDAVVKLFVNDPDLDLDRFLMVANEGRERIRILRPLKWFLVDFVKVQCPKGLKRVIENGKHKGKPNRVHAPIYKELEKYEIDVAPYESPSAIRALPEPQQSLNKASSKGKVSLHDKDKDIDKDKEKEKDKDKDKDKKLFGISPPLGEGGSNAPFDPMTAYRRFFDLYSHPPGTKAISPLSDFSAAEIFIKNITDEEAEIWVWEELGKFKLSGAPLPKLYDWLKMQIEKTEEITN